MINNNYSNKFGSKNNGSFTTNLPIKRRKIRLLIKRPSKKVSHNSNAMRYGIIRPTKNYAVSKVVFHKIKEITIHELKINEIHHDD
mmetsp:Transcript_34893/g.39835  ORF Transcript_34893/g.39835 Transcript_34893/m.39835 type:complete len:86 (+) Transcript_34893:66-323(+)